MTEDAPGNFSVEDGDALDYSLSFPAADASKLSDAASLTHMMNANTFTCGAYHVKNAADAKTLAQSLRDSIQSRQWMCGFPDKVAVAVVGEYVVSVFGAEDLVDTFMSHMNGIFGVQPVYDEAIL